MKFTVASGDLRNALQIVTMALAPKTPMAIAECVLIKVMDGVVRLTCSDQVMEVSMTIPSDAEDEGRCAVRGKLFEEVIKKMPEGDIVIAVDDKAQKMVIRGGAAKYQMSCMDAETFPLKAEFEPTSTVRITPSCLLEMISDTEACIARQDMREVLNGGCIDVEKSVVRMVALDGFRMGVKGFLCSCENDMKAIVPAKSLSVLKKIIGANEDTPVDMEFSDTDFQLRIGNTSIKCTLISGEYVQWRKIVPPSFNTIVTVSSESLRSAVDRAYIIAKSGAANNLVRFEIDDNRMSIFARSDLDEMFDSIDVAQEGNSIKIAFNVVYLNDLLKVFNSGDIVLKFVNSVSPCIVEYAEPVEAKDFFWLILPVRQS